MGFLDACGTFLSSIGAPGTPGHLQIMLNQTLILFTMITAFMFLGTKYSIGETVFAMVIFIGAIYSCMSGNSNTEDSSSDSSSSSEPAPSLITAPIMIYLLSNVPMALSNVYKEIGFQEIRLDVWTMTCVTTLYQTALTFFLLLFQQFPYLSGYPDRGLDLSESWKLFVDGGRCFFGSVEVTEEDKIECVKWIGVNVDEWPFSMLNSEETSDIAQVLTETTKSSSIIESSSSDYIHILIPFAGLMLVAYVALNLGFNCIGLALTKQGAEMGIGAVLCSLAYAVKLPLSNMLFASPTIMGVNWLVLCL